MDLFSYTPREVREARTAAPVDRLAGLREALPGMSARDQEFARSLMAQAARRGLSDKQWVWVKRLSSPKADVPKADVGDMSALVALLGRAAEHLRYPAIIVRAEGRDMRLSVAGAKSKTPGAINVCSVDRGEWFGRVGLDGRFEPCRRYDESISGAIAGALRAMADNPAAAAAAYGHLTGVCCFCGRRLDDSRSTTVGYGPVCAKHFGLPWGV